MAAQYQSDKPTDPSLSILPPPAQPTPSDSASQVMDSLLNANLTDPSSDISSSPLSPQTPPTAPPPSPKTQINKKTPLGLFLTILILLVISLPIAVYYVSQQKKPIANTQSKAEDAPNSTPAAQCQKIKIYKNGSVVTNLAALLPGDNVTLSVTGPGTKGRVRINGAIWIETTITNINGEFIVPFIVPTGQTTFTVEAEILKNGAWQ